MNFWLAKIFCRKNKFNKLRTHAQTKKKIKKAQNTHTKKKKKKKEKETNVYNTASESYNDLLETYFDQYNDLY